MKACVEMDREGLSTMTDVEIDTRYALNTSKRLMKDALRGLDPSPAEPVAIAMLAAIDALDRAASELQRRQPDAAGLPKREGGTR